MKRFDIDKHLSFNYGIHDGKDILSPCFYKTATIITDLPVIPLKELDIELLYEGTLKNLPNDLIDKVLVRADSSYNPSRPFRWYKFVQLCAYTDDEQSIIDTRNASIGHMLKGIDNAEYFYIYNITIL
jgi:hypothetical protein